MGPEMRPGRKFTLEHIRALLKALGEPEKTFPAVLIAGTNGKGSTAATLASIANAAGLRTGMYTSPHLLRVNERIRTSVAGLLMDIDDEDFARIFARVDASATRLADDGSLPHHASFFELM